MSITTNKAVAKAELIARIAAIDALFALPKDYLDFLYSCLPEDVKCKCSSKNLEYDDCYRSARCLDCKGKVRPTAQTIFNNIRRPTDWVRFIFLMAQGFSVSANLFAEVTGMSQSSVSDMSLKIRLIFLESIQGTESALSSMCEAVITKRSERTPAMEHPTAEENEFKVASSTNSTNVDEIVEQALSTLFPEQKHTNGFNFETEKGIFKTILDKPLSLEQIVKATKLAVSEVISALTNLQLADLAQLKSDGHYETTATFKQRIVTGLSSRRHWRYEPISLA